MDQKLTFHKYPFLKELGLGEDNLGVYHSGKWTAHGESATMVNPTTNEPIARVQLGTPQDYADCIKAMKAEQPKWAETPAPLRGEMIRQIGIKLREKKDALGMLLSLEMGKIKTEGLGEV